MISFATKAMYFVFALFALPQAPRPQAPADIRAEALARHNNFRALHGASPLVWSADLATAANTWASKCVFKHSGGQVGPYGGTLSNGLSPVTQGAHD